MGENRTVQEQVHDLYKWLIDSGVTEAQIADLGGMSRQAINARKLGKPGSSAPQTLGLGFAILRAAFQAGHTTQVLSILSGREVKESTFINALLLYPDLTEEESRKLSEFERIMERQPLPGALIASIMQNLRAPRS